MSPNRYQLLEATSENIELVYTSATNILSPNRYQLLEPTSENIELVSGNIQNTDALPLSGNET